MSGLIQFLKWLFKTFILDFWPGLKKFFLFLLWLVLWLCGKAKKKDKPQPKRPKCVPVNHPAMKFPDPMIYDQYYLMSLGLAVTWQNPDIQILQGGVPVASDLELQPATTYTIRATIYNQSTQGVVVNMPVAFSYLSFGMGTQSHVIPGPLPTVSLGVKGTPQGIATAEMPWTTPATPGHYCVQVTFAYIDDINPFNNLGQNNTEVVQAASPAQFSFQLRNAAATRQPFHFEFDTYQIQAPPTCQPAGTNKVAGSPVRGNYNGSTATGRRNSRGLNPLPPGWTIAFNPATPTLDPNEEITVNATITPPDTFVGTQPVNIHAFANVNLAGGITVMVNKA